MRVFRRKAVMPSREAKINKLTDQEAADIALKYQAAKKFLNTLQGDKWKLAQAGTNKFLLIGKSRVYKVPGM